MTGVRVDLPKEFLKGYATDDFGCFVVDCDDMFPLCRKGDKILVNTRITPDHSEPRLYVIYDDGEYMLRYAKYTDDGL